MSTVHEGLRYTRYGSPSVEWRLANIMAKAATLVAKSFTNHECRALVLIGGYGRGEGGVIWRDGTERPHNNIDFLLVTSIVDAFRTKSLKERLDTILGAIVHEQQIGIDTGVMSEFALRTAAPQILFFDLRWGHRTILGDPALIPSLPPLGWRDLQMDDVHDLLVNRASLLVINDAMIDRGVISDLHAEFIIKHLMKAIIGHGDAMLFAKGQYHASYVERQRRMRTCQTMVSGLAELYELAVEFRFAPDYTQYNGKPLGPFLERVREVLLRAHLEFERFRSNNAHCTFDGHAERILGERKKSNSWRQFAKRLTSATIFGSAHQPIPGLSPKQTQAFYGAHPRAVLAAALPAILYETTEEQRQFVQRILGASENTPRALRNAYLRHWSQHGDPNFPTTAKRLGLCSHTMEWPS